uniref:Reverse transcriptase RNase H-like domain-containing protein n=1 Tax=Mycena chlorophos TaxID=658473 RepID=A0ABQ0KUG4_MYCCL|nr:predicted protein [Mycena chlorophos]
MLIQESTTLPSSKGIISGHLRLGNSLYGVVGTTTGQLLSCGSSGPTVATVLPNQLYTLFLPHNPQCKGRFNILAVPLPTPRHAVVRPLRSEAVLPTIQRSSDNKTWRLCAEAREKWGELESHLSMIGQAVFTSLLETGCPLSQLQLPPGASADGYNDIYFQQDACRKALAASRTAFFEQAAALAMLLLLHRGNNVVTDHNEYWASLLSLLHRKTSMPVSLIQSILENPNITNWRLPRAGGVFRVSFALQHAELRTVAEQLVLFVGWFGLPIPMYIEYGPLAPLLQGIPSTLQLSPTFYPSSAELEFLRNAPGIAFSAWRNDPDGLLLQPDAANWHLNQLDENDFAPEPPEPGTRQLLRESYAEFVARRQATNQELQAHESEAQRDKRQAREKKEIQRGLPTRSTRVFVWERRGRQQIRVLLDYDAYAAHWVQYDKSRRFYDSFHHEWDLCQYKVEFLSAAGLDESASEDAEEDSNNDDDDNNMEVTEEESDSMSEEVGGSEDSEEENQSESEPMRGPAGLGPSFVFPYHSLQFSVFDALEQQLGIVIPMSQRLHSAQETDDDAARRTIYQLLERKFDRDANLLPPIVLQLAGDLGQDVALSMEKAKLFDFNQAGWSKKSHKQGVYLRKLDDLSLARDDLGAEKVQEWFVLKGRRPGQDWRNYDSSYHPQTMDAAVILVPTAALALEIVRCWSPSKMNLVDIAREMLDRGVSFRLASRPKYLPSSAPLPPEKHRSQYRTEKWYQEPSVKLRYSVNFEDFNDYEVRLARLLRTYKGGAALQRGGIVGRIALGIASRQDALRVPSARDGSEDEIALLTCEEKRESYVIARLSAQDMMRICGAFMRPMPRGVQQELVSWWPLPWIWEKCTKASRWTNAHEEWYQQRRNDLKAAVLLGTSHSMLKNLGQWKAAFNKRPSEIPTVGARSEKSAYEKLARGAVNDMQ